MNFLPRAEITKTESDGQLQLPFTSRTGGFRIESIPVMLEVTYDPKAHEDENRSCSRKITRWYPFIIFGVVMAVLSFSAISNSQWILLLLPPVFLAYFIVSQAIAIANNIRCTPETLQVIRITRGKEKESWSFPREEVGPISYTVFSSSRYGSTCGLQFAVQSQRVRVLSGLEIIEAQLLLNELSRLGYEVVRDIAMPMAVEIAKERRSSIFH